MYIKSIRIRNFRKIIDQEIELSNFNVFVGLNDSGKSTILKALNLFFNLETESGRSFNFDEDFCKNAKKIKKKADEIIVELELNAPRTYKPESSIIWKKNWRKEGIIKEEIIYSNGNQVPSKKKIRAWLNKIKYRYVPAVKSQDFFIELLGDLHDTLAIALEDELKNASNKFSDEIKKSTMGITKEIATKIKIESILDLPPDLRNIFRSLEFKTGKEEILLIHRGDGIKTRHIPIILKFIADQENLRKIKGTPIISTIWGYEEPENSLEMFAAFESAKNFYEYSEKIQMLITTHSPAFYSIELLEKIDSDIKIKENIKIQFVEPDETKGIKLYTKKATLIDINDKIGMLPLIEPKIKEIIEENNRIKKELESTKKDLIIVEGKEDKTILQKAIEVFSPKIKKLLEDEKIEIQYSTAGADGVADKLIAICHSDKYKAIGIFDKDSAGKSGLEKVSKIEKCKENNGKKIKYVELKLSKELSPIITKIPTFEFELEDLYSKEALKYAKKRKYLEPRELKLPVKFPQNKTVQEYIKAQFPEKNIQMRCLNKIADKHKESMSKWIVKQNNCNILLANFKSTIEEIEKFFG